MIKLLVALIFGAIGAIDSVALVLGHRDHFKSAPYALAWAFANGSAHTIVKVVGASIGPFAADWLVRVLVAGFGLVVLVQGYQHLKHTKTHDVRYLWLPAIVLGCLDALPLSLTKGLVVGQSIPSLLLSTAVLVTLPFLASQVRFPKRARRWVRPNALVHLARLTHFGIFAAVVPWVSLGAFMQPAEAGIVSGCIAGALVLTVTLRPSLRSH